MPESDYLTVTLRTTPTLDTLNAYLAEAEADTPTADFGFGTVYPGNVYWAIADQFTEYVCYILDEDTVDPRLIEWFNMVLELWCDFCTDNHWSYELPDRIDIDEGGRLIFFSFEE